MWDLSQRITLTSKQPSEGMIINFENNFVIITGCCEMLRITKLYLKLNLKEQRIKITTYRKIIPSAFSTSANRYVCIHITLCVHLRSFSFLLSLYTPVYPSITFYHVSIRKVTSYLNNWLFASALGLSLTKDESRSSLWSSAIH